nr:retrovirus-related Pol polyprotein from transposon TNT 1-94 [Tanacetum cinerariifolium]
MKKDSEIYKGKKERVKSIALKSKKESTDDETSTSGSNDEEYAMVANSLREMLNNQKSPSCKIGLGFDDSKVSTSETTIMNFVGSSAEKATDGSTFPRSVCLRTCLEPDEWIKDSGCSKHMTGNKSLFSTYKAYDGGNVVFRSNLKGKIIGKGKTPYEIFSGKKPSLEYFKVFGRKCFILNTKDHLTKFDPKSYEDVFLGYSQNSKAYVVLNKHTMKIEESVNVTFDESPPPTKLSTLVDDDVGEEEAIRMNTKIVNTNTNDDEFIEVDEIVNIKESKNRPLDQVIGNLNQRTL